MWALHLRLFYPSIVIKITTTFLHFFSIYHLFYKKYRGTKCLPLSIAKYKSTRRKNELKKKQNEEKKQGLKVQKNTFFFPIEKYFFFSIQYSKVFYLIMLQDLIIRVLPTFTVLCYCKYFFFQILILFGLNIFLVLLVY